MECQLDVEKCKSVLFVKRSLSPGYAGMIMIYSIKKILYVVCRCKKNDRRRICRSYE